MNRLLIVLLIVAVGAVAWIGGGRATGRAAGGVGRPTAGGPALTRDPPQPVVRVRGSVPGTSLGLLSLRRSGPKVVTAKLRVYAGRSPQPPSSFGRDEMWLGEDALDDTVGAMRLIDEVNGREHFPLTDRDDHCLCSIFELLRPGEQEDIYAKFPAPPPGVTRVALHVRDFPSFDGVRIDP